MRTERFKRGVVSILLVLSLGFSMISVASLASSGDLIYDPGGGNIEVMPGKNFLIRHTLEWNKPEDGAYAITLYWVNYDNDPSENFTFVETSAYFTTGPNAGESILAVVELGSAPAGTNTKHVLSVKCPPNQKDSKNGQFNVDITLSASGVDGIPHIPGDHVIPWQFGEIIIFENDMKSWHRDPITIRVLGRGVSVSISPSENSASPGQSAAFTVTVTNTGTENDNYVLTVSDNENWALTLDNENFCNVAAGESRQTTLIVTIPENAAHCTRDKIIVTATSQENTDVSDNASCIAHATILDVLIAPSYQSGSFGGTLDYTVTVTNTGTENDNYDLTVVGDQKWYLELENDMLEVPMGENRHTTLSVTIPEYATPCTEDNITVTATSQADDAVRDSASCIAHVAAAPPPRPPPPPPGVEWDAHITATFSGGSDDAIFGVRPDATPNFDSAYDIPEPPAPVAPSYVRTFFYYSEQTPDELHRSCLAPENLMGWPLRIEYAEGLEDITLTWNVEDVPADYSVFLYRGDNIVADMRAGENYTFEASTGSYDFWIDMGKLLPFTLELDQGWNMISFPVLPENPSPDSIFGSYYVLYRWDAEDKRYVLHADSGSFVEPDPIVEVGVGYWAYVLENENVDLLGVPATQLTLNLRQGWDLIGPPYDGSSIADPADDPDISVLPYAFTWNAREKSYSMTQLLEAGKGYWAYALRDCTLMLMARAQLVVELAYDDGTWEYSRMVSPGYGGISAVKFSLPTGWTSAKLLTARYCMGHALEFKVHIYTSDGVTELTAPFTVTPTEVGWFDVDLSGLNIIVTGDFYIAKEGIIPSWVPPCIYVDSSPPIDGRSYTMPSGRTSWIQATEWDMGIRAVVMEPR